MAKKTRGIKPLVKHERRYGNRVFKIMKEEVLKPANSALDDYTPDSYLNNIDKIENNVVSNVPDISHPVVTEELSKIEQSQRVRFIALLVSAKIIKPNDVETMSIGPLGSPKVGQTLSNFIEENVNLITKGTADQVEALRKFVKKQIEDNPFDLQVQQDAIEKYLATNGEKAAKNRSRLITRDQNNKLVGKLNRDQHEGVGGSRYIWSTSGDERVRPSHAENDGKEFFWNNPPATGHPGEDILCRCDAEFIFE